MSLEFLSEVTTKPCGCKFATANGNWIYRHKDCNINHNEDCVKMKKVKKAYLARVREGFGIENILVLVNHITGQNILKELPIGIPIEVNFEWEEREKKKEVITLDSKGDMNLEMAAKAINLIRKPNAKITIEWEE